MSKRVVLRRTAVDDIDAALAHYLAEAGPDIATRFIEALERVTSTMGRQPRQGSLRFAFELEIPGLRASPVPRFPYLVFYVERDAHIDVWRVLHVRRDIPASLAEDPEV